MEPVNISLNENRLIVVLTALALVALLLTAAIPAISYTMSSHACLVGSGYLAGRSLAQGDMAGGAVGVLICGGSIILLASGPPGWMLALGL